jgi:hypothetical protein
MDRSLTTLALSCTLLVPLLAGTACKKGEKDKPAPEAKPAETVKEPVKTPVFEQGPVKADVALIDKSLQALADATLAVAAKPGDEGGLPSIKGENGISCGSDPEISAALAHVGFAPKGLQAGAGFRFDDVCVGWQPYVKPRLEIYWMISAGDESKQSGMLEHRRCIRVRSDKDTFSKDEIMDGPCLGVHRRDNANIKQREAMEAAEKKTPVKK